MSEIFQTAIEMYPVSVKVQAHLSGGHNSYLTTTVPSTTEATVPEDTTVAADIPTIPESTTTMATSTPFPTVDTSPVGTAFPDIPVIPALPVLQATTIWFDISYPVTPEVRQLPNTGATSSNETLAIGGSALLLGAVALLSARRRKPVTR